MNISYDNWKPRYVDEYTGEVLQDQLVRTAMIDELDYFNQHVWGVDTVDHMKTVQDYILVRSRWVMANKGDSAAPDVRARLERLDLTPTHRMPSTVLYCTLALLYCTVLYCTVLYSAVATVELASATVALALL